MAKEKAKFQAKPYENSKGVHRMNITGNREDFMALVKGDEKTLDALQTAITEGLKAK
jgi:hypothetical protein